MRKFLLAFFLIYGFSGISQDAVVDSLLKRLSLASEDTNRLRILSLLVDNIYDDNVWPKYNEQGYELSLKLEKSNVEAVKQTALLAKATCLANFGERARQKGDIPAALDYFERQLKVYELIRSDLGIANAFTHIGNIHVNHGNVKKGIEYFNRGLAIFERLENKERIAFTYIHMGNGYFHLDSFQIALKYYNFAIKKLEELGDKSEVANIIFNTGRVYDALKNHAMAIEHYKRSAAVYESIGNFAGLAFANAATASSLIQMKKFKEAYAYCEISNKYSRDLGLVNVLKMSEHMMFLIDSTAGNSLRALDHYKKFIIFRDSLNGVSLRTAVIENQYKVDYHIQSTRDSLLNEAKINEQKMQHDQAIAKQRIYTYGGLIGFILMLAVAGVSFRAYKSKQKTNTLIIKQKHLIEEKHKEITDSINYAERIQRSFLASKELLDQNLDDYFVYFQPKDIVSGDFYWAQKLSNEHFVLVTADSTGHGVPGAIMSILNISSLERSVELGYLTPSEIMNSTRKIIIERLKKDGSSEGGKDGMDCSLVCFDIKNSRMHYAAANNPVWILRRGDKESDVQLIELSPDKMPVGKHEKDQIPFAQHTVDLRKGDLVYTLTDGFPDQFGGPKGKKFMYKQLKNLLLGLIDLPLNEQRDRIANTLGLWKGDLEQVDDITIIGIRI